MNLNLIKAIYHKHLVNIILNGRKLKPLHVKSTFSTLIQQSPGIPNKSIRQEEDTKGIQIRKIEVKISLFADNMILYLKRPEKLHQKTSRHHKHL
jgi:hypothetical protein